MSGGDRAGGGTLPTLAEMANALFGPKRRDLDVALAHISDRRQKTADERQRLVDERSRVADDPLPAPDRLAVRPADRTGRAGAPLFACCDFRDGVADHDRSGIEAALHAAGLLDAWVSAERSGSDARSRRHRARRVAHGRSRDARADPRRRAHRGPGRRIRAWATTS